MASAAAAAAAPPRDVISLIPHANAILWTCEPSAPPSVDTKTIAQIEKIVVVAILRAIKERRSAVTFLTKDDVEKENFTKVLSDVKYERGYEFRTEENLGSTTFIVTLNKLGSTALGVSTPHDVESVLTTDVFELSKTVKIDQMRTKLALCTMVPRPRSSDTVDVWIKSNDYSAGVKADYLSTTYYDIPWRGEVLKSIELDGIDVKHDVKVSLMIGEQVLFGFPTEFFTDASGHLKLDLWLPVCFKGGDGLSFWITRRGTWSYSGPVPRNKLLVKFATFSPAEVAELYQQYNFTRYVTIPSSMDQTYVFGDSRKLISADEAGSFVPIEITSDTKISCRQLLNTLLVGSTHVGIWEHFRENRLFFDTETVADIVATNFRFDGLDKTLRMLLDVTARGEETRRDVLKMSKA